MKNYLLISTSKTHESRIDFTNEKIIPAAIQYPLQLQFVRIKIPAAIYGISDSWSIDILKRYNFLNFWFFVR